MLEGADLDVAIDGKAMAKNAPHRPDACGQPVLRARVAGQRVHRPTHRRDGHVRVGTGLEPDVQCGPVISAAAADRLDRTVKEAIAEGAQLVTGGSPPHDGFFFEPTVLTDVPPDAAILDQELFGPVARIATFSDVDEMVERANATEMGLAGYVFGPELGRGLAVAERLQVGMVGLDRGYASDPSAPFGGMERIRASDTRVGSRASTTSARRSSSPLAGSRRPDRRAADLIGWPDDPHGVPRPRHEPPAQLLAAHSLALARSPAR